MFYFYRAVDLHFELVKVLFLCSRHHVLQLVYGYHHLVCSDTCLYTEHWYRGQPST